MRILASLAALVLAAALLFGCGGSSAETGSSTAPGAQISTAPAGASARSCRSRKAQVKSLRVTGTTCTEGRHLMLGWLVSDACRPPVAASRSGCPAHSYRCIATATDRGWSVDCSKPNSSIAFSVRRPANGVRSG
ncbi:MAG: hypothetical protein ACTHN3_04190 [Solirubrobacterales bacterium]